MAQQINLLTPILLTPRRYFSALALLQATGLLVLAGVGAAVWLQWRDRQAAAEHLAEMARLAAERQSLLVAQAGLPTGQDATSLQAQLLPLEAGNAERRSLLQSLGTAHDDAQGLRHSDLLALVARTLPESAWLQGLRYAPGRLELSGGTLDTAALRPWLGQLAEHPLLAGQQLSALQVERLGAPGAAPSDAATLLPAAAESQTTRVPVWRFRVTSAPAASAPAPGGSP